MNVLELTHRSSNMHGLALLVLLFAEHDASHWEMSCDEWNQARIEILSDKNLNSCLLYTSPSPRDSDQSRMPSSA